MAVSKKNDGIDQARRRDEVNAPKVTVIARPATTFSSLKGKIEDKSARRDADHRSNAKRPLPLTSLGVAVALADARWRRKLTEDEIKRVAAIKSLVPGAFDGMTDAHIAYSLHTTKEAMKYLSASFHPDSVEKRRAAALRSGLLGDVLTGNVLNDSIEGLTDAAKSTWDGLSPTSKVVLTGAATAAALPTFAKLFGRRTDIDIHAPASNASTPAANASAVTPIGASGGIGAGATSGYTLLGKPRSLTDRALMVANQDTFEVSAKIPADTPYQLLQMGRTYAARTADAAWRTFVTDAPPTSLGSSPSATLSGDILTTPDYYAPRFMVNQSGDVVEGWAMGSAAALLRQETSVSPHPSIPDPYMELEGGFLGQGGWFKDTARSFGKIAKGPIGKVAGKVLKGLPVVGQAIMIADVAAAALGTDLGTVVGKGVDKVTEMFSSEPTPPPGASDPKIANAPAAPLAAKVTMASVVESSASGKTKMTSDEELGLAIDVMVADNLKQRGYSEADVLEMMDALNDNAGGGEGDVMDADGEYTSDLFQGGYPSRSMRLITNAFRKTGSKSARSVSKARSVKIKRNGRADSITPPDKPHIPASTVSKADQARAAFFEVLAKSSAARVALGVTALGTIGLASYHVGQWKKRSRDRELIVDRLGPPTAERLFELSDAVEVDGVTGLTNAEQLEFIAILSDLEGQGVAEFSNKRASLRAAAIDAQRKRGDINPFTPQPGDVQSTVLSDTSGLVTLKSDGTAQTASEVADETSKRSKITNPMLAPFVGILPANVLTGLQTATPFLLTIGGTALVMTILNKAIAKHKKETQKGGLNDMVIPVSLI